MKKTDIIVIAFMYGVCALFLALCLRLPRPAQIYPEFIIAMLFALTSMYLVKMLLAARKYGVSSGLSDFEGFLPAQFVPVLAFIVLYLVAMYLVGFYISTLLFMAVCLRFLKVPLPQLGIATASVLLLVYGAFNLFLGVRLPAGLLFR